MLLEVYVAHACTRPCVCIMPVPMRITCVRLSPPVCAVSFVLGFVIIKYSFLVIFEITILRANWLRPIVSYGNAAGFWSGEGGGRGSIFVLSITVLQQLIYPMYITLTFKCIYLF